MGEDSIIGERAFREIYLRPFQIAQKKATPWAYMTSYNKVNGTHCSESTRILKDVLRGEFEHEGLVMSDWYGTYSVSESINATLDLEMPGPTIWRNPTQVLHLLGAHKIDMRQIDTVAGNVLTWVQKLARLNPDLVYAEPSDEKTRWDEKDADAKLLRRLAGEGIVLLKNEKEALPIKNKKIAVIGPNAKTKVITGGGSAQLKAAWSQTPYEALVDNKPEGVEIEYAFGAITSKFLPQLDENFTTLDGKPGVNLAHYNLESGKQASKAFDEKVADTTDYMMADYAHPDKTGSEWITEVNAIFTAPIDGEYEFGVVVTGQGWLYLDDQLVVENVKGDYGSAYFGNGTQEVKGSLKVQKGKQYKLKAVHDGRKAGAGADRNTPFNITGFRIGAFQVYKPDEAVKDAVELAKKVDVPVLVVGLNADWESEGFDRPTLDLPLNTNELISAVADANPNTVVVIQAGSAVAMPWVDKVASVVYAWYGGNEAGNAIADVVYGKINPSGRLSVSLPVRQADIAANLNYKSAREKIHYEEGIWVGYKHHNAREIKPLFPYGHGLSYTTFEYSDLKITQAPPKGPFNKKKENAENWSLKASVTVKNTGKVAGHHSVHFYTQPPTETATSLKHPQWSLQAFEKVYDLAPGATKTVEVTLDKYAVTHWDDVWKTWRAELGEWSVKVGTDAQTMYGDAKFTIEEELEWVGM